MMDSRHLSADLGPEPHGRGGHVGLPHLEAYARLRDFVAGCEKGIVRLARLFVMTPPNKRMQRTRDMDKFVLRLGHRRVADARRYAH